MPAASDSPFNWTLSPWGPRGRARRPRANPLADNEAMEIKPGSPSVQRHVTWAANRKIRAAASTLDALRQAWLTHCQSGHISLEESRNRVEHTISFIVRVTRHNLCPAHGGPVA